MEKSMDAQHSAPNVPAAGGAKAAPAAGRRIEFAAAKLVVLLRHADHPDEPVRLEIPLKGEGEALFEREALDRAFELAQLTRDRLENPPPPAPPAPPKRRRLFGLF
jgi:hypothetical protein